VADLIGAASLVLSEKALETLKERLCAYNVLTAPLIDYYAKTGSLRPHTEVRRR